ncbi:hypothetical protein, partial [Campylobacter sp. US33a]|uniref:hypothetical protein n=1 Tax=Campylobacter sp. US33a TaxID=2498120 RepID=UPI001ABB6E17
NTISGANVLIGENKPSVNINPESIGSLYVDKINANLWMCKDNTVGLNVWLNLIDKSQIKPQTPKNIYKFNLLEAVGSAYGVCLSGVMLYDYNGERLYLKAINRDVSVATKPTAFLLFTKEICESISDNAELNKDYEVGENEILAFLTCEERYANSTYYYPDYIFKPYNASDTLSYYMSSKKSGFVQIEVFGEKNKLGKIEFRNGVSGRITSKLTLSYFTSDINAEIKEIST